MSSTNKTAELHLSQFIGTDIPSILTDYNGDMQKIDAGVREVKQATAGAVSDLSSVTARVTNAEQDISGLNSTVQGIATKVVTAESDIGDINDEIASIKLNDVKLVKVYENLSTVDLTAEGGNIIDAIYNSGAKFAIAKIGNELLWCMNIADNYIVFANSAWLNVTTTGTPHVATKVERSLQLQKANNKYQYVSIYTVLSGVTPTINPYEVETTVSNLTIYAFV